MVIDPPVGPRPGRRWRRNLMCVAAGLGGVGGACTRWVALDLDGDGPPGDVADETEEPTSSAGGTHDRGDSGGSGAQGESSETHGGSEDSPDTGDDVDDEVGDLGVEGGSEDGGAGEDSGPGSSGPCPAQTHVCMAVPEGWDGPWALGVRTWSQGLPLCLGDYGVEGGVLFADLHAPPAECTCLCGEQPTAPSCAVAIREVSDCVGRASLEQWTLHEGCTALGPIRVGHSFETEVNLLEPGQCARMSESRVEPAKWQSKAGLCGLTAEPLVAACAENQRCIPRPSWAFNGRVCIRRIGRHACPAPFVGTSAWFLDEIHELVDDRGCSNCTCSAVAVRCGGKVNMHVDEACAPREIHPWALDTCVTWGIATGVSSASYAESIVDPGSCDKAGGEPEGKAEARRPMSLCCL